MQEPTGITLEMKPLNDRVEYSFPKNIEVTIFIRVGVMEQCWVRTRITVPIVALMNWRCNFGISSFWTICFFICSMGCFYLVLSQRATDIVGDCDMLNKPICKPHYLYPSTTFKKSVCEKLQATELWERDHKFNMLDWENWKAIWTRKPDLTLYT